MGLPVFVFGTLKRGFPLHERGLAGARCLGEYRAVRSYPLVIAGRWFAPMLLDEPSEGHKVEGELYEIDGVILERLDRLESVGVPGNLSVVVEVESVSGGAGPTGLRPRQSARWPPPLHSGWLERYTDRRFVPPEDRAAPG